MVRSQTPFPKAGEFVLARVKYIEKLYVYVDLEDFKGLPSDEYAKGMVHISEISSRWIKNIRRHVRIGQKVVLRVIRVEPVKGHVDLSLRRVSTAQRQNRTKEWKYALRYENLLQFLADETDYTLDNAYEEIGFPVLRFFDSYQETIEELKENGAEVLGLLETVPKEIKNAFLKIVDDNIDISTVGINGKIKLTVISDNGIEVIKEILTEALKIIEDPKDTRKFTISYIAAPFYRLEIVSKDYLDAENILSDILEYIEKQLQSHKNSKFEFIRD